MCAGDFGELVDEGLSAGLVGGVVYYLGGISEMFNARYLYRLSK